jgi:hypothetical protein
MEFFKNASDRPAGGHRRRSDYFFKTFFSPKNIGEKVGDFDSGYY